MRIIVSVRNCSFDLAAGIQEPANQERPTHLQRAVLGEGGLSWQPVNFVPL